MLRFRPYRNGDTPALADLWNRGLPGRNAARPLRVHEFDALVMGKLGFEPEGLIVAERAGRAVGFAHGGFGPEQPAGPSHRPDRTMGTVAMLAVEPGDEDADGLAHALVVEAARALRRRGASVLYAGGTDPLNPFYWGLYGGSEFAGILEGHAAFHRAVRAVGFAPAATAACLEVDLAVPEVRQPRAPVIRRLAWVEVVEDAVLPRWWDELALGPFRTTRLRLLRRSDGLELARAAAWDMEGFARLDHRARVGLVALEVHPEHRRQGFGRHLVGEALRHFRDQMAHAVAVQTASTNAPALALYHSLGFVPVETATLYRLPAEAMARLDAPA